MKSFYFTALVFLLVAVYFTSSASAYLGERSSPFTIEATDKQDVPITLQHGDTLHIQW